MAEISKPPDPLVPGSQLDKGRVQLAGPSLSLCLLICKTWEVVLSYLQQREGAMKSKQVNPYGRKCLVNCPVSIQMLGGEGKLQILQIGVLLYK